MITPPLGVPKPVAGSKDPKKTNDAGQSAYRAREMDEKARKEREDKQRKLVLQRRALELKEMDLRMQEEKYNSLRREITQLENKSRDFVAANSKSVEEVRNLERRNAAKVAEDERQIKAIEQEMADTDHDVASEMAALIIQKEQEEKQDSTHIVQIKDEIKRKTLELKTAEDEDKKLQQEIAGLKKQPKNNVKKIPERKARIEKLRSEISLLDQSLGAKKQQSEKANKDSIDSHNALLQAKIQESKLVANRVTALDQEIKMIKDRIQALER